MKNFFKSYRLALIEIGLTFALLFFLILTTFNKNTFDDNTGLLLTMIFFIIYTVSSIRYWLAYTNNITANRKVNNRLKDILNILWQSAAHLILGIVILDYVYIYLKNDLYCIIILLLTIITAITDFLIRYKKIK